MIIIIELRVSRNLEIKLRNPPTR